MRCNPRDQCHIQTTSHTKYNSKTKRSPNLALKFSTLWWETGLGKERIWNEMLTLTNGTCTDLSRCVCFHCPEAYWRNWQSRLGGKCKAWVEHTLQGAGVACMQELVRMDCGRHCSTKAEATALKCLCPPPILSLYLPKSVMTYLKQRIHFFFLGKMWQFRLEEKHATVQEN